MNVSELSPIPEDLKNMPNQNKALTTKENGYEKRHGEYHMPYKFTPQSHEEEKLHSLLKVGYPTLSEKKIQKIIKGKFTQRFLKSQNKTK